jgi:hypothetical protein
MDSSIVLKIVRDLFRFGKIAYPKADVLTLAHDNDRSFLHEGKWYSPLIDTIEDDLRARGATCLSVARIISRIKGDLAYGHVVSPEGAFARALVLKRLLGRLRPAAYPFSGMEEAIWGEILDQSGVRKVLGIQPSRELCVACHKRGIWVADVQHGVIGESHPWYGQRFRGEEPPEYLPSAFLVWDKGSQTVIDMWAKTKGASTIVTGNRWVARFLRPRKDDALVGPLLTHYAGRRLNPQRKPSVLVALSWGEVNIPNGFMVDDLISVIRETAGDYYWSVRLHPNQLNGFATHEGRNFTRFFQEKLEGHVEWEVATRSPLPLALLHADLLVSWNSSSAIEASQMGVRSALLDPRLRGDGSLRDYYRYYRDEGMIDTIDANHDVIGRWLAEHSARRVEPESFTAFDAAYSDLLGFLSAP